MDAIKTGRLIKESRLEKGMTQKQLAEQLSVTTFAISKWENGRGLPDITLLEPIAHILSLTLNELILGQKQNMNENDQAVKELIEQAKQETKHKIMRISVITILVTTLVIITSFFGMRYIMSHDIHYVNYKQDGGKLGSGEVYETTPNVIVVESYGELFVRYNDDNLCYKYAYSSMNGEDSADEFIFYLANNWRTTSASYYEMYRNDIVTKEDGKELYSYDNVKCNKIYYYNGNDEKLISLLKDNYQSLINHEMTNDEQIDDYCNSHLNQIKRDSIVLYDSSNPEANQIYKFY